MSCRWCPLAGRILSDYKLNQVVFWFHKFDKQKGYLNENFLHIVIVNLLIFSMPVSIFTVIILLLLFVLIMLVLLKHLLQDYTKRTS